jgi:hypothetical protein
MVLVLGFLAVPVLAGPPIQGIYFSNDMPGGTFNPGYFSESWVDPGRDGQLGNTVNAQSWDGAVLGAEWKVWCPSIQMPPVLVSDTRDAQGSGDVTWRTSYSGGHFFLSGAGPWGDNSQDYFGDVGFFIVTTTYLYVEHNILGIRSNVTTRGQIDGFTDCMEYSINNAAFFGNTDDFGPKPPEFPEFLDENCQAGVWSRGGWGSATEITIRLLGECDVATVPTSWGKIKSLYGD